MDPSYKSLIGIGKASMSKMARKVCFFFVGLAFLIMGGVLSGEVYAENKIETSEDEKGCYYVSFNVGEAQGKTNSICFKDYEDNNGSLRTYLSGSDGAAQPIKLSDGRKIYMELVGLNPDNLPEGTMLLDGENSANGAAVTPNAQNGGAKPDSSMGVPHVALYYSFDGKTWEQINYVNLNKLVGQDARKGSFQHIADMTEAGQFAGQFADLEPAGASIDGADTGESAPGDRADEEQPENYDTIKDETCRNAEGAESLGWIVCPIIDWMGDAAEGLYNDYVEPSLQVKPELFSGDKDGKNSVRDAWGVFRDMANVLFAIIFLVVIFSQLTGIGIDNYGIKKILPRLIVVAILINLSYLLCIIMVDLSNILGNGLQAIFRGLSDNLGEGGAITINAMEGSAFSNGGSTLSITSMLAGVGLFGGIVGMVGLAIWASPAIILSLLVSGLGVIISMLFLFILLAARKAAIIVLVAISPLAVATYMLPNTKKLSDKWWKFFEGLLLVYPIAGLLVGAGDYVSRLLLVSSDGFFTWVTAMVVGIVPVFFIPMVLKSSFAAMGKVGGMLTGMGSAARKRATGAVRASDGYKELQARSQTRKTEMRTRFRAGLDANGNVRRLGRLGVLARGGRRQVAAARTQYDKMQADRIREDMWMDPQYSANRAMYRETAASNEREKMYSDLFASRARDVNQGELRSALTGGDAEKATAALSTLVKQGGISEALGELSGADWSNMNVGVRNRLVQAMGTSGIDAMKSYSKYVSTGGAASFSDWASGNINATQRAAEAAAGVKDGTYAQHLMDGGEKAMTNYTKDEMQFVQSNADAIRQGMENQALANGGTAVDGKNEFGAMLKNTAINSGDAKAQTVAENTISSQLGSGALDVGHLGITSEDIGNMRGKTAEAILGGEEQLYFNHLRATVPGISEATARVQAHGDAQRYIRSSLGGQIAGAMGDSTIAGKTKSGTKTVFGMP